MSDTHSHAETAFPADWPRRGVLPGQPRPRRILRRSSWASAELSDKVAATVRRRFTTLRIVKGTIGPDGRASTPELAGELKGVAVFLASDASNDVTGQRLVVDGGRTIA